MSKNKICFDNFFIFIEIIHNNYQGEKVKISHIKERLLQQ